jgi:hypothetical protein
MFHTIVVEKIKTHILHSVALFKENRAVCDSRTGQRRQYSMVQALDGLDKDGYRQALKICNTYGFSTATMVTRTPLNITA